MTAGVGGGAGSEEAGLAETGEGFGREIAAARGREDCGGEGDRLWGRAGDSMDVGEAFWGGEDGISRLPPLRRASKRILVEAVRFAALTEFFSSA